MKYDIDVYKKDLRSKLSDYRYYHSIRVADVSSSLADIYGIDKNKAYVAGLLHDIAKEFSDLDNDKVIRKYDLYSIVNNISNKRVLHGIIGAYYLEDKYKLDNDIINAIKYHTIGSVNMDLLGKIVFVADKIEPNKNYPGIEEERKLAYEDIDRAMILCIENNIKKLESEHKDIDKSVFKVLKYLKKNK